MCARVSVFFSLSLTSTPSFRPATLAAVALSAAAISSALASTPSSNLVRLRAWAVTFLKSNTLSAVSIVKLNLDSAIAQASSLTAPVLLARASTAAALPPNLVTVALVAAVAGEAAKARAAAAATRSCGERGEGRRGEGERARGLLCVCRKAFFFAGEAAAAAGQPARQPWRPLPPSFHPPAVARPTRSTFGGCRQGGMGGEGGARAAGRTPEGDSPRFETARTRGHTIPPRPAHPAPNATRSPLVRIGWRVGAQLGGWAGRGRGLRREGGWRDEGGGNAGVSPVSSFFFFLGARSPSAGPRARPPPPPPRALGTPPGSR